MLSGLRASLRKLGVKGVICTFAALSLCALLVGVDVSNDHKLFALLLGVGLLNATFGINLKGLGRREWVLILLSISIGVVCKAAFTGIIMWAFTNNPQYLVLGVAVAQIDPISVGVLMEHSRLSEKGKDILRAVSSLDDPVSILLVVLLLALQPMLGVDFGLSGTTNTISSLTGVGEYFVHNFAFMASLVFLFEWAYRGSDIRKLIFTIIFLAGALIVGTTWAFAFGLALTGLFMRPKDPHVLKQLEEILGWLGNAAFGVAVGIVAYLIYGQGSAMLPGLLPGVCLGGLVFLAQVLFAPGLTFGSGLDRQDRFYLAFGHQNGVTAIMLALTTSALPIILPAIVMTHVLRMISTLILDLRFKPRGNAA